MEVERAELELPAARGVRVVALRLLDDANTAAAAFASDDVESALHDFRVAIRRLRSWFRAFDDEIRDDVPRKAQRKLKALANATNEARDREVQREWLARAGGRRGARHTAAEWLERYFDVGDGGVHSEILISVGKDFAKARDVLTRALTQDLSDELARPEHEKALNTHVSDAALAAATAPVRTLGDAIAERIGPHLLALNEAAAHVHAVSDEAAAHEARIAAKRLRYLIEPARAVKGATEVLRHLRGLQEALGTLHDGHVMAHELRRVLDKVARSSARQASRKALGRALVERAKGDDRYGDAPSAGIILLMRFLRRDITSAFGAAQRLFDTAATAALSAEAARLEANLRHPVPETPV